jgi:hypothetical protein
VPSSILFFLRTQWITNFYFLAGKAGIQLWQFLSHLLDNPEKKYGDLIKWTSNKSEREFRMLEPESVAVWWGHLKNKPGMTYEKFSRSLRYYYDKGILKKTPGERFVYKFLVDPELLYEHIGLAADTRPKIKPMPKAAKAVMSHFQKARSADFKVNDMPRITPKAETLEISSEAMIHTSMQNAAISNSALSSPHCSNSFHFTSWSPASTPGDLVFPSMPPADHQVLSTLPVRRSKSLETPKVDVLFSHHQVSYPFPSPSVCNEQEAFIHKTRMVPELGVSSQYDSFYW